MALPLMPKATAVWLVDNTALTFEQIAEFCGMHALEVQGVADGEVAVGIVGIDPTANGQLTRAEIERCERDPKARLKLIEAAVPLRRRTTKGARYTPVSKRQDRPAAIAWLLRNHPELSDAQVQRMLGTTKATIDKIRDRTHWNMQNIKPQDPVSLGACSQEELSAAVAKAREREERRAQKESVGQAKPEISTSDALMAAALATSTLKPKPEPEPEPEPDAAPEAVPTVESVFGPADDEAEAAPSDENQA